MSVIADRINEMKEILKKAGVDFYIVPTADFHNSEYVNEYFKVREFLSGFTGSNGTLVISQEETGLWTDGRYFVQAAKELTGSGIVLYRMAEEGVPTIEEYLDSHVKNGQTIGFDGRVIDAAFGRKLEKMLNDRNVTFEYETDLADALWTDRPGMPASDIWVVPEAQCGKTVARKLAEVREAMSKEQASHMLLAKLDDIMWLYNIRANDVDCNPVALSYTFISEKDAVIFVQNKALTEEAKAHFEKYKVQVKDYTQIVQFLETCELKGKVMCAYSEINYLLYKLLEKRGELLDRENPTSILKAIKNPVELENIRKYYL